jgi:CMP-N-acetylneuraminic acid synthetase
MAFEGLSVLAVVPARGGSKGIPRKNLATVGGRSLIARTAEVVRALPWIDRAVLSTDDAEIADEGRAQGLLVPFLRPAELAGDAASAAGAWAHAWRACESSFGERYDVSLWLQPTSPLRRSDEIERTLQAMIAGGHRAAATVSRVPAHHTPEKTLRMDETGRLSFLHPEGAKHGNRQSIPAYWTRNGICYAVTRDTLLGHGWIVEHDCVGVVIEHPVANIDEPIDLLFAEFLLARGIG